MTLLPSEMLLKYLLKCTERTPTMFQIMFNAIFYLCPFGMSYGTLSGKTHTARYILVRQLIGTWTSRYWAVPLRSAVGGRLRPSTVDFHCRWSISAVCGRFKEKSTVGG
ncbi:hypothetical protein BHE74_00023922 [Ensete ventricosum]|nr:hypothetical protein BHE74_00023922 [Ensete ventricosum]